MDQMTAVSPTGGAQSAAEARKSFAPLFCADAATTSSATAPSAALDLLADLAIHRHAETPLTIGLFGVPGAGKSHALRRLTSRIAALAASAGSTSPFLSRIVTVPLDAAALETESAAGIARAIHSALVSAPDGAHTALAREAVHAASDPHTAAREANERLDQARHRLDDERRALDELGSRRARLPETVLFDSAGTRIDAYARRNRARLETSLRGFGFSGEPIGTYKDLVRDLADHPGLTARISAFLRSLWAFDGQTQLIVWAIVFFLLAWGLGIADQTRDVWLGSLRSTGESAAGPANWIEAHASWFGSLRQTAVAVALLCLAGNVWRAVRFTLPLMRGAKLLESDVEKRRLDLDGLIAHQTRRADMLASEVDAHARQVQDAENRARTSETSGATLEAELPFDAETQPHARLASAYLDSLQMGMRRGGGAPQRIILCIDGLDALSARAAATLLEVLHRVANRTGFVTIFTANAEQLSSGWGSPSETATRLERYVQAPLTIRGLDASQAASDYARMLLGTVDAPAPGPVDATRSALDAPMEPAEQDLLATLAPLAGETPRAVKRFLNIYRIARPRTADRSALALMLALDSGATSDELAALATAMDLQTPQSPLVIEPSEARLAAAVSAVNANRASSLTSADAHAAWSIARDYRTPAT